MASTRQGEWILDPFCGSSTTGNAANLLGRRFLGIDQEQAFLKMSRKRREELENCNTFARYRSKIKDISVSDTMLPQMANENIEMIEDLPF